MSKLLSIIIPIHNSEENINKLIKNINYLSNKKIEFIFIDDSSVDNSFKKLNQKKSKNTRLIKLKKNMGVSYCRNLGIKKSKGKYIQFLDSDDTVDVKSVKKLLNILEKKNIDFFYIFDDSKKLENNHIINFKSKSFLNCISDKKNFRLTCWNYIINKKFLIKNKIIFENKIRVFEDQLFVLNIIYTSKHFDKLKGVIYKKNLKNPNSLSKTIGPVIIKSCIATLNKYEKLLKNINNKKFISFFKFRFQYILEQLYLNFYLLEKKQQKKITIFLDKLFERKIFLKKIPSLKIVNMKTKKDRFINIGKINSVKKENKKVIIYCMGLYGKILYSLLNKLNINVSYIVDENKDFISKKISNQSIVKPDKILKLKFKKNFSIFIANKNIYTVNKIKNNLIRAGYEQNLINTFR